MTSSSISLIVLTAGKGTRLYPLTKNQPKPIIKIAGEPLLVDILKKSQYFCKDINIVVGYKADLIKKEISNFKTISNIKWIIQETQKGTGHAIQMCLDKISTTHFVSIYGDIMVHEQDYINFFDRVQKLKDDEGLILAHKVENPEVYGCLQTDDSNLVKIHEKSTNPPSNLINAGMIAFPVKMKDIIFKTENSERGEVEITDSVNLAIKNGFKFYINEIKNYWIDIGYPWDILEANSIKMRELTPYNTNNLPKGVTLNGNVYIAESAELRPGVFIEGPVIIDENAVIGPNCFIRGSTYIGKNVRIGNAVEIKNSIIMDNTNIGHLSYLGDSVISNKCNFGAGTKVANLRLDKKNIFMNINKKRIDSGRRKLGVFMGSNVKTGINVSLMPGTKIGENSQIGAHSLVNTDIDPNTLFYTEGINTVKKIKNS